MNQYIVKFLDAQGGLVTRTLQAFTAAMAERSASQLWGGSYHTATKEVSS